MPASLCAVDKDREPAAAAEARRALVLRLKRVEGQLRGIQSMIETGNECEAIAQQMSAARKALDKAFFELAACAIAHPQFDAPPMDAGRSAREGRQAEKPEERVQRIARTLAKFA
jgi:DNA-binding FrmR family transcriptional regulator